MNDVIYREAVQRRKSHPEVRKAMQGLERAVTANYSWNPPKSINGFRTQINTTVDEIIQARAQYPSKRQEGEKRDYLVGELEGYVATIQGIGGPDYDCTLMNESNWIKWVGRAALGLTFVGLAQITNNIINYAYETANNIPHGFVWPGRWNTCLFQDFTEMINCFARGEARFDLSDPEQRSFRNLVVGNFMAAIAIPTLATIPITKAYRRLKERELNKKRKKLREQIIPIHTDTVSSAISNNLFPLENLS